MLTESIFAWTIWSCLQALGPSPGHRELDDMGIPGVVGVLPGQEIVKLLLAPTPRPGLAVALVIG